VLGEYYETKINQTITRPRTALVVPSGGSVAVKGAKMNHVRSARGQKTVVLALGWAFSVLVLLTLQAPAASFTFSTGDPDGLMATASRPGPGTGSGVNQETESGDDFLLSNRTSITTATFTGLLPTGVDISNDIAQVRIEIYRIFPTDSDTNRTIHVPTRANSPSDVAFDDRDSASSNLSFTVTLLDSSFAVSNSVDTGIHPSPDQTTGGDGPVTGQEVRVDVTFTTPFDLPADQYFFIPQVLLADADEHFLWLSAPKPIVAPGTPFAGDLQEWIRNADLDPDWLRVATDIVGAAPTFNAAFSLAGEIPTHDLAVLSVKPPKNINLKGARPSLTKRVKVQIQNLSPHSETISNLTVLGNLVSVTLSNLQDSGCTPPTADLIQGPPNKVPRTLKPNGKLNVFFNVTFDAQGCVPDHEKGPEHQDFSYTAHVDHAALDGNPDTNPANDTLEADVVTDVFLKQRQAD
jgi:hypothetical protein